jgi:phosphoribosylformylglycinamidine synthase
MIIKHKGTVEADLPVPVLANSAPMYKRPYIEPKKPAKILPEWVPAPNSILGTLKDMMGGPHLSSRRWIWEQYDHMVMGDTVGRPGGDAGVVRVHGTQKAIAVACDVTPRYVTADPEEGTKQAVVETWRNLTATGADPLAITDNMNFANPERPEIMGQFVASVRGMGEACRVLDYPVVSGNVSLYNETNGVGIPPTPAIGGVGLIPDATKLADIRLKTEGNVLIVIGREEGHLGQSLYQQHATGKFEGAPPPVDLEAEVKAGRLIRTLIREGRVLAVHDCADGGLLVAIAEMALAGGKHGLSREASGIGVELYAYEGKLPPHAVWFGEDQGRYVVEVTPQKAEEVLERARLLELPARIVGRVGGDTINLKGETALPLAELRAAHEGFLPKLMGA